MIFLLKLVFCAFFYAEKLHFNAFALCGTSAVACIQKTNAIFGTHLKDCEGM